MRGSQAKSTTSWQPGRFGAERLRTFERGSVPDGATGLPAGWAAFAEVGRAVTALRSAWPRASARGRERRSKH